LGRPIFNAVWRQGFPPSAFAHCDQVPTRPKSTCVVNGTRKKSLTRRAGAIRMEQLVAGNFRWLNLSGTRNTPAFPPISIN